MTDSKEINQSTQGQTASPRPSLNQWFLSLPEERQAILRDDKWMLAEAAFAEGLRLGAGGVAVGSGLGS